MMRCVIYARKSTEDKSKQVYSIASQLKILQKLASDRGFCVIKIITEEKSAKETGRKGFTELISMIEKGDCEAVLCWDPDRLARNMIDGAAIIHSLQNGLFKQIITPTEVYDQNTDTIILSIKFGMATQFIRTLRKNTTRGIKHRLEQGFFPTNNPFGYRSDKNKNKVPDHNAVFVQKCFKLYLTAQYSFRSLAIEMTRRGMTRANGNPPTSKTIEKILSNHFYYGVLKWQHFTSNKATYYKGGHDALISKEVFDRVQQIKLGAFGARKNKHRLAYNNLITYNQCFLTGETQKGQVYYRNHRDKSMIVLFDGKKYKTIPERYLDSIFTEFFKRLNITNDIIEKFTNILNKGVKQEKQKEAKYLESLETQRRQIKKNINRLTVDYYKGGLEASDFTHMKHEEEKRYEHITEAIKTAHSEDLGSMMDNLERCLALAKALQDFSSMPVDIRHTSLELFTERIEVANSTISWVLRPEIKAIFKQCGILTLDFYEPCQNSSQSHKSLSKNIKSAQWQPVMVTLRTFHRYVDTSPAWGTLRIILAK